ncbi:MAG: hypothetical protein CVU55_03800 [Deltaproteobacteria bacterium HGW-Deltaproteobacteria-13]|jgi:alpha-1,6-mannosyltransferase|nr:MAG: hypothetical protein CVU55_03800 [Deltaproteobacteria bacterium HGW-Deltaproteobacteria-13]
MKICDIIMFNYTSTNGGIETYIAKKADFFARQPNTEHIIIMPGEKNGLQRKGNLSLYSVCSKKGIRVDIFEMRRNRKKISEILKKERPDIIEVSQVYVLPETAFAYSKINNIPVVNFYHTHMPYLVELTVPEFISHGAVRVLQYIAMKKYRSVYNRFDTTLVATDILRKFLINQKVSNTCLVPFGVDLNLFNPNKKEDNLRRKFKIGNDELILVYHGRFHKDKRIDILIDSLARLPKSLKARLLLIGDQPLYKDIHNQVEGNGNIILYPYTKNQDLLSRMLASSDIYVSASPFESFGLSLVEAQASGLPVVAMKGGGIPEVVPPISGELGKPGDSGEFVENILKVIKRGHKKVGDEARKYVEQNYSWDNTFAKLLTLYSTLVRNKKVFESNVLFKQELQSSDNLADEKLQQAKI